MTTDTSKRILAYIRTNKQAKAVDLVREIGITNAAIHRQLNKLMDAGEITKVGKPPTVFYILNSETTQHDKLGGMQQDIQLTIEQIKKRILPLLKEEGVLRSSLFGSFVHGEQTDKSDIDILVEFPQGKSLLDLVGLELKLEEALGRKVDLLTYNSLSPYIKESIKNDQLPIL